MSMISTATASVVGDPTLGDSHNSVNCIRILVATQGDGTLFSPSSFQEEDLMGLCMGLGQAHQGSVFQILETKALFAFHSTTKMMAAMHLLGTAIMWCNEPIRLCTHPPTTTNLRAYVTERGICPSGTQSLTPGREMVSQSPLATLKLRRGSHLFCRCPLETLGMPN